MEKKQKLPARAAARVDQAAKKRREPSSTPAPAHPARDPTPPRPPLPPPLPTSIQVGKPLPTVEDAQPDDLSAKEYQSISESGVLAESLSRSRHRWTSEGLFEKYYWTKPYKRKGVLHEDPKNPPKDSMAKVGNVTITIEPHIIEATMFAVKASKLPPQQQLLDAQTQGQPKQQQQQQQPPAAARPILQYGPPNGSMPPPPTPASTAATPATTVPALAAAAPPKSVAPPSPATNPSQPSPSPIPRQQCPAPSAGPPKSASPGPTPTTAASPGLAPRPYPAPSPAPQAGAPQATAASRPTSHPPRQSVAPSPGNSAPAHPATRPSPSTAPSPSPAGTARPPSAPKPAANDPVIALLAQKASGDPELRDLMKRVAVGQAKDGELAQFQKIIDQLNAEYRQKGGQQGPSADRLLVDGRTVKYFADEVRTILDIVLASNPHQKSSELRPPPRSDPLVVLLVKTALEDQRTKDMIHRIAEGRPGFTDAQDLKDILDRLHRDAKTIPKGPPPPPSPAAAPAAAPSQARQPTPNGLLNGHAKASSSHAAPLANPQALRSKGPPAAKPDISAVVFDFGTGDRYLFPKYSILEFLPAQTGQQVVASFLIVRKGSTSEYGGDPSLDYYQPVTIRLQTSTGRHLENLARVVAPQDEVQRYMDDVMDNMTRAEYILLAMRLPRVGQDGGQDMAGAGEEPETSCSTPRSDPEPERGQPSRPGVLWMSDSARKSLESDAVKFRDPEQESQSKYERLIQSVAEKEPETI